MATEAILATALKEAEAKRKQHLLNSSQIDVLAGPYGVLPAAIELLIDTLGNEKAAMVLHIIANGHENIFQNLLKDPTINATRVEIIKLRDIVKNNNITIKKEYDVTGQGHDYLSLNTEGRQIAIAEVTKSMAENLVGSLGNYDVNVAKEVTSFTINYLNSTAQQLFPKMNTTSLSTIELSTNSNAASNNEWIETAEQAAETVLLVDFDSEVNATSSTKHNGYASREYQINTDHLLALQLQMEEIMVFALENAIRQTQAVYMLSMAVATAQYLTTFMIQSCQYQDILNTKAAHLLDQTGLGFFASTQANRYSTTQTNDAQKNVFDHSFPALPPTFTAN